MLSNRKRQKPEASLAYWRNQILQSLLTVVVIAGFFTAIPSVWLSVREGLYSIAVFDGVVYAAMLFAFLTKRLAFMVKAVIFSTTAYLLGLVLLLVIGPFGAGPVWLFAFPVFTAVLLGQSASIIALSINAITVVMVGLALYFGKIGDWGIALENPIAKWSVISVNFLFLDLLVTISLTKMLNGLQSALSHEQEIRKSLKQSQEQLEASNRALQTENQEKKIAVANLNQSESRYRRLFNEAPLMYVLTESIDDRPYIRDVNDLFVSKLGYSRTDVIGQPITRFYDEASLDKIPRGSYAQILSGNFVPQERCLITRNGDRIDAMLHIVPEFDEHKGIRGARGMFVDITERKRAEAQAKQLEANLHRSQRLEAIGTLAGGIAHDFNNILSAILGYAELCLLDTPKTHPIYDQIKAIHEGGMRARQLVKQILAFSRHNEKALVPVRIDHQVKEVLKLLRASLPATIELHQDIRSELPCVLADATQIHQVLMNLCTNAAHAMEENGGRLGISARKMELPKGDSKLSEDMTPGDYVFIRVEDNGCGISEDILPRIFEPYYSTKDKGEGTGLGLAVVHGIVRSCNGTIRVHSTPDAGTTVDVYLPAVHASPPTEEIHTTVEDGDDDNAHIMIVDDEPAVLNIAGTMLRNLGYGVTTVGNAGEALARFKAEPKIYDLLLLDMTMPKVNGDQLAAEMRTIRADVPVVLFSGYSKRLVGRTAESLGVSAILSKPFHQAELVRAVRQAMGAAPTEPPTISVDDPASNIKNQSPNIK